MWLTKTVSAIKVGAKTGNGQSMNNILYRAGEKNVERYKL